MGRGRALRHPTIRPLSAGNEPRKVLGPDKQCGGPAIIAPVTRQRIHHFIVGIDFTTAGFSRKRNYGTENGPVLKVSQGLVPKSEAA